MDGAPPTSLLCIDGPCGCLRTDHPRRRVVVTGGPGAGKTAVLEMVRRNFCHHVAVLPESAGIIFGGGFPRDRTPLGRRASQRTIYHVQRELERYVLEKENVAVALCDRGTLDGAAYWPGPPEEMWRELGTSPEAELARYAAVVHLRTPPAENGYNHSNPLRIETAAEAAAVDLRIQAAWRRHPRVLEVAHTTDFVDKVARALAFIRAEVPACCRGTEPPITR